ncbi:hypothetical protein [Rubripirellula reticaptiva]|uniref:hypothetical protein n=1 Tax=Rubripirellula reticaptiva TaxID=2528013 RepID=UPI0011B68E4D|nr:hypothetical protein [Rubripirellula reticaptiva]
MNSYRQYRAPVENGSSLIEPPLSDAADLLGSNVAKSAEQGPFWDSLRTRARASLIEDAIRYTSAYRDTSWVDVESIGPIVMAGHQPSLFHPGVWFKNFALDDIARRVGGIGINLVVDNDVASGSSIRVPSVRPHGATGAAQPHYEVVSYDEAGGGVPYEQTTVRRRDLFDHFDEAVAEAVCGVVDDPSVTRLWRHALSAIDRCGVAGCALAQARHGLEGELGLRTLELPLGVVCRTSAYAEFVLAILTELPRFHGCYNDSADRYRSAHGIRSSAHPVPNLAEQDGWFEAPLWIYGNDSPDRKAAWVKMSDDHLVISDRVAEGPRELRIDVRHPKLAAEQLSNLVSPNFKLRPRALVTTMYARMVLSDLFLHGIGGGKYDQLGDQICAEFFQVEPLQFMVISATIQLPGLVKVDHDKRIRSLRRQLRDLVFQPERFADRVDLDENLLARKAELIAMVATPKSGDLLASKMPAPKKQWHDEIATINAELSKQLDQLRGQLRSELAESERAHAAQRLMASREHPFCVFPIDYLQTTYAKLLGQD